MGESLACGLIVFAPAGKPPIPDKTPCAGKLTQLCFLVGRRCQPIAISGLDRTWHDDCLSKASLSVEVALRDAPNTLNAPLPTCQDVVHVEVEAVQLIEM